MSVIEAKTCRTRRESDSSFAVCGNVRCTFFRRPVYIHRHHLAVPVQLFGNISVIDDIHRHRLAFLEADQRPRKLSVVVRD